MEWRRGGGTEESPGIVYSLGGVVTISSIERYDIIAKTSAILSTKLATARHGAASTGNYDLGIVIAGYGGTYLNSTEVLSYSDESIAWWLLITYYNDNGINVRTGVTASTDLCCR